MTFARVTYLLAIGMDRLQAADRPPIAIPVYLGDSVQWGHGETLMHAEGLRSPPTKDPACGRMPCGSRSGCSTTLTGSTSSYPSLPTGPPTGHPARPFPR